MKKRFFFSIFAATAMLLATSCQKDEEGSQAKVSFNLNQPGMETKAYSDGLTATTLSYLVFEQGIATAVVGGDDISFSSGGAVNFTLLRGRTYDIVFWADAVNSPYTFDTVTGTVTVDYTSGVTSQDENRDAFFGTESDLYVDGTINKTITLKRPFAQLNIGTADIAAATAANFTPAQTSVTVSKVYSTLNLLDSSVSNPVTDLLYSMAAIPTSETFPVAGLAYLSMNYLLVDEQELVDIDFVVSDGSSDITCEVTNIPVQRNYRTNIYGNLLTSTAEITVVIDPIYDGENNYGTGIPDGLVDLGLSVLWATNNIGAATPDAIGDYYAWASLNANPIDFSAPNHPNGVLSYNWNMYPYYTSDGNDDVTLETEMTKYTATDGYTTILAEDDIATVTNGTGWRMPTSAEYQELITECTWTWDANNNGYVITGPNGNSIFLPGTPYKYKAYTWGSATEDCLYWTSTLGTTSRLSAFYLDAKNGNQPSVEEDNQYVPRLCGMPVRPVYER